LADGAVTREVAAAVGLAEGEAGVRAVVTALARLEPVSIRRLSRAVELPVPIVAAICAELRKRAVVARERPAQLTARGRELFADGGLDLGGQACPCCSGRGVVLEGLRGVVRALARAALEAPGPRLDLDQCHCTVETKLRRVLAIHAADALVGRRVLLLGDDDLISVAIRSVARHHGSGDTIAGLTVVDVDPELLRFLRRFAVCVRHDLREPLPASLRGVFDTVVTDPPYTVEGARVFLSRAAEALDGAGDVFLSFGSRRPGAAFAVQRAIAECGFAIRSLERDFNEYVGAGALGGSSHLYHLTATDELRPVVTGRSRKPLYTAG
jgi:hypothetical protein